MPRNTGAGGSRYPSAYGHTPSYRSYVKGGMDMDTSYPSALGSSSLGSSGLGSGYGLGSGSGSGMGGSRSLVDSFDMSMPMTGYGGSGNNTSSSSKVQQSYSSYSSNATGGARPVVEYNKDSTYKSVNTGNSGVPHTSFAKSNTSYSSEDPYKNRTSNYSYNI
jgi:hypothetical protein